MSNLETLLANAIIVRVEPGSVLFIGNAGFLDGDWERAMPELEALKASVGASRIWLFHNEIDMKAMPAETLASELLAMAEHNPEVGKALEEFIAKRGLTA